MRSLHTTEPLFATTRETPCAAVKTQRNKKKAGGGQGTEKGNRAKR